MVAAFRVGREVPDPIGAGHASRQGVAQHPGAEHDARAVAVADVRVIQEPPHVVMRSSLVRHVHVHVRDRPAALSGSTLSGAGAAVLLDQRVHRPKQPGEVERIDADPKHIDRGHPYCVRATPETKYTPAISEFPLL